MSGPETDLLIEDARWQGLGLQALAEQAFAAALRELGLDPARFAVSLLACDDARIAGLNAEFRGRPVATNVLSWPAETRRPPAPGLSPPLPQVPEGAPPLELGDIAIAHETIAAEAENAGLSLRDHAAHLLIHALLHLLGYDHVCDRDATLMERIEVAALARLGIADPYEDTGGRDAE